jgi:hypothetical protein
MALLISELFKASRAFAASEVLLQIIKLLWIVSVAIDAHIHKTSFVAKMFVFVENRSPLGIVTDCNLSCERWHFVFPFSRHRADA